MCVEFSLIHREKYLINIRARKSMSDKHRYSRHAPDRDSFVVELFAERQYLEISGPGGNANYIIFPLTTEASLPLTTSCFCSIDHHFESESWTELKTESTLERSPWWS